MKGSFKTAHMVSDPMPSTIDKEILESGLSHYTFSGTPQGGIVSPILVNIYLDRLEEFMMGIHPEI